MNRVVERMMFYTTPDFISLVSPQLNYALQIVPDAPFRLYGIAVFPLDGGLGTAINQLQMRFTRPDGSWMQRNLVPTFALAPGQPPTTAITGTQPSPNFFLASAIYPNLIYPPNSTITIDIARIDGTNVALDTVVCFIGTSLYEEGRVYSPSKIQHPSARRPFFGYNMLCPAGSLALGPVFDLPLVISGDADFLWQQSVHTDVPVGQSYLAFEVENPGAILFATSQLGLPPGLITINITSPEPAANQPLTVTVVGNTVNISIATDGSGVDSSNWSDIVAAANTNLAFVGLGLTAVLQGDGPAAAVSGTLSGGGSGSSIASGQGIDGNLINLAVRVKDWSGKYYSNVTTNQNSSLAGFVPAAVMFGFNNGQLPGLVYPQIYLPRNSTLSFDFAVLDGSLNPNLQTPILTLKGQKVYA